MIAEACPITVCTVTAHLDTGRAAYGEPASVICDMPADSVAIVPESSDDNQTQLWRVDVNAHAPQPEDRAAAFQEQQTFEPYGAIDVRLAMSGFGSSHDATMLALYQHKEWWMRPTWVCTPSELPERTQLLLCRSNDVQNPAWLVLVAICGTEDRADFGGLPAAERGCMSLRLTVSSNRIGRTALCDTAAYVACGPDPYMAIHAATQAAAKHLGILTRKERPFPSALTGLGWCTWDSLGRDVNEQAIFDKMEEFKAKHVPISWVLIDDGWSNVESTKETLIDFGADRQRFPHGLAHTIALLKTKYGVRSVGVWQAFQGYWSGLAESGEAVAGCRNALTATNNGCLIPGNSVEQATRFWDSWDSQLACAGVDFVKVDSQSSTSVMVRSAESYGEATWGRHQALDEVASRRFGGALINCMGMASEDYWHRPSSPITRSSDDYLPHSPESLAEHLMQNAYCALLMGELYHCDWDMFWTEHPHARVHAVLRLLSGGPVYCSDACGRTDASVLRDLLSEDGTLPRPDEPARPVIESLLHDPERTDQALGVAAKFGTERVIAFVGLRQQPQIGIITAGEHPCRIIDEQGMTIDLASGQTHTCEVACGQLRVFRVQS